jgi:hypothetical protein
MDKKDQEYIHYFLIFIFFSLLFHFLLLNHVPFHFLFEKKDKPLQIKSPLPIQILSLTEKKTPSQPMPKNLKTLGIENSKNHYFNLPSGNPKKISQPIRNSKTQNRVTKLNQSYKTSPTQQYDTNPNRESDDLSSSHFENQNSEIQIGQEHLIDPNRINTGSPLQHTPHALFTHSTLNFSYLPPKGVPLHELNTVEFILYGFHKRIFEMYVNAINKYYFIYGQKISSSLQQFNNPITLHSTVTYSLEGKVMAYKAVDNNFPDVINLFFKESLTSFQIKNIPRIIMMDRKELKITYQLVISL